MVRDTHPGMYTVRDTHPGSIVGEVYHPGSIVGEVYHPGMYRLYHPWVYLHIPPVRPQHWLPVQQHRVSRSEALGSGRRLITSMRLREALRS